MNKKILLTGGAGYIGSHTAVALLENGYDVVIADNFSNSSPDVIKRIEKLTGKRVTLYAVDVAEKEALRPVFMEQEINAVIHFAGFKAVGESVAKPLLYYRNNLDTTLTLLELMQEYQVKQFVFSSSATVYGVPETVPVREEAATYCLNPYGWTKWMIEQILRDICGKDADFSAVFLRYFNPIGAHESGMIGEKPNGIPNNLLPYVAMVAEGKLQELSVLAKGHLKAMEYAKEHKGTEIFNLGTGIGYSVLDIVKTFEQVNHVAVPYKIVERRPGDVAECYADTEKAEKVLGWKAEKSLEDMCRDIWRWQQYLQKEILNKKEMQGDIK